MMGSGPPELMYWLMVLGLICLQGGGRCRPTRLIYLQLRRHFPQLQANRTSRWLTRPHVVIVGAGFGGLAAAARLRWTKARVTLIRSA